MPSSLQDAREHAFDEWHVQDAREHAYDEWHVEMLPIRDLAMRL